MLVVKRVNCFLHCLEHAPKLFVVGDVTIKVIWFDLIYMFDSLWQLDQPFCI